jgi:molecular chaperone Hsp33
LSRFVFEGAAVRGARVLLSGAADAILAAHPYPQPLARVIAELLAAATLLASMLKFDGSLTLQLQGDGPVRLLVVECDQGLSLRATAQWDPDRVAPLRADASLADLAGGDRHARLVITLDPKGAGNLYQGIVALEATSVAALIEHYLSASEQVPSRLALAVNEGEVAGILVQRMPGGDAEDDRTWERARETLARAAPEAVVSAARDHAGLSALFPADDLRVFRSTTPRFFCGCGPARVERALRIAGRHEIEAALAERGEVEVVCEFCNQRYVYGPEAARALFSGAAGKRPSSH